MTIRVVCQCGAKFSAKPEWAGKRTKCPKCGHPLVVPTPEEPLTPLAVPVVAEPFATGRLATGNLGSTTNLGTTTDPFWDPLGGPGTAMPASPYPTAPVPAMPTFPAHPMATSSAPSGQGSSRTVVWIAVGVGVASLLLLAVLIFVAISFIPRPGKRPVANLDSPESTYEAYKQATLDDDQRAIYELLTPESQQMTVGFAVYSLVTESDYDRDAAKLLKKHGIEPNAQMSSQLMAASESEDPQAILKATGEVTKKLTDPRAFYFEVIEYYEGYDDDEPGFFDLGAMLDRAQMSNSTRLKNLVVEGDKARAVESTTIYGESYDNPMEFHRINNKWYVHMQFGAGEW